MPNYLFIRQIQSTPVIFVPATEVLLIRGEVLKNELHDELILPSDCSDFRSLFESVAERITSRLQGGQSLHILVDKIDTTHLTPLQSSHCSSLIAMLILAFPEVRWTFCVVHGCPDNIDDENGEPTTEYLQWTKFRQLHGLGSLCQARGAPLFDGYGLRHFIIEGINQSISRKPKKTDGSEVTDRPNVAIVLDDEKSYSQFVALMAYRGGFRVHAVGSWSEAKTLFDSNSKVFNEGELLLTLEDLYLSFPDQGGEIENSKLDKRGENLPALAFPDGDPKLRRRFLTVGHRKIKTDVVGRRKHWRKLREYEQRLFGQKVKNSQQVILKPVTGLYTLWEEMGLSSVRWKTGEKKLKYAPGYFWPPSNITNKEDEQEDGQTKQDDHSAEGRLAQIAELLLERANAHLDGSNTVTESTKGAVLASQALELLGCKTPTLSQEALSLKHQFEVMAECQFSGVEFHLSMRKRVDDIKENLKAMAEWLRPKRKRDFRYNAAAQILSRLTKILEEHNAFEEAEFCRIRLRSLNKRIELRDSVRQKKPWKFLFALVIGSYADWVLRSLAHFAFIWFIFLGVFIVLFYISAEGHFSDAAHQAVDSFLTVSVYSPSNSVNDIWWWYPISYLAAATGVLNISLLITHLYAKMARQ